MELNEIIEQAKRGDAVAFDRLVAGHRDMAVGYARTLVRDRETAEDAVQEAFLVAHRRLDGLANSAAFASWLRSIVRFRCLRGSDRDEAESWHDLDQVPDREDLERWIGYAPLAEAVADLQPNQRTVLGLLYEDGLTQAEIGERLQLSIATVNMRLHAARQRLKRRLMNMNEDRTMTPSLGRVESADGPLVTLRFAPDEAPMHYSRLTAKADQLCVVRLLGNGLVQAAATRLGAIWTPGQEVYDSGEPFLDVLPDAVATAIVGNLRSSGSALATGIKTIDVFAPFAQNGAVGIFSESGLGSLVLIPELVRRLDKPTNRLSIYAFGGGILDERQWREVNAETNAGSANVEVLYIPVADPICPAFIESVPFLNTRLVLARSLAEQGIWPCIDPLRSSSSVQDPERQDVAEATNALIRRFYELQFSVGGEAARKLTRDDWTAVQRGRQAIRFLSQPFHVAEPYTGHPGVDADGAVATQTFANILAGYFDGKAKDAFSMTGAVPKL